MKVKIVKFNNGMFAIRKGIFFPEYADINDMKFSRSVYWWSDFSRIYTDHYMTKDVTFLESLIANYKPKPDLKEDMVMSVHKIDID
jgi:hypothetical protein